MEKQDWKSNLRDFAASYAGSKATSVSSACAVLLFLSLGTLFTDFKGQASDFGDWILVSTKSYILGVAYFFIFANLINRFVQKISKIRVIFVTALNFSTEMIRAIFVAQSELNLKLTQSIDWDYRIIAGGLTGILFFGIFSIVKNDAQMYRDKITELKKVQLDLENTTKVTSADLLTIKNNAINVIQKELNKSFSEFLSRFSKSSESGQRVVNELMRVADEIIRPLSHEVFALNGTENTKKFVEQPIRIFSSKIMELATLNPFFPLQMTFFAAIQIVGLAFFGVENIYEGVLGLAAYSSWIFITLCVAKKYLNPLLPKLNLPLRFFVISIVYINLALCPFLFDFVSNTLQIPQNLVFVVWLSAIALIMIWPVTFYVAIRSARSKAVEEIKSNNERLSWSSARLGAQLWDQKQKFAHLLHKDIQGGLISSALKLKNDLDAGKNPADSIESIRALLQTNVSFNSEKISHRNTNDHINYLNDIWAGVFNLELEVSAQARVRLLNDSIAQNSVNDLLSEFVTNSVKHGKAKIGLVQINLLSDKVLELKLQNDGLPFPEIIQNGLGSQMALEQCLTIDRKNLDNQGVQFIFTIPID